MARRLYVVAYDVAAPRRWRKVYKLLKGYGQWIQLSVFRCRLTSTRRATLERDLARLIDTDRDRVLIIDLGPLPRADAAVHALGHGPEPPNQGPWIV